MSSTTRSILIPLLLAAATSSAAEAPAPPADETLPAEPSPTFLDSDTTRRDVVLEYSTVPMLRNASLAVAGWETASRGLELAARPVLGGVLAKRDGWGVTARLVWAFAIDAPLSHVASVLNHEHGHLSRLPRDAANTSVRLTGSYPFFGGSNSADLRRDVTATERLAGIAGGWEAGSLFVSRTRASLYDSDTMHAVDAFTYVTEKLDASGYILNDTAESRLRSWTAEDRASDPLVYALSLSEIEEGSGFTLSGYQDRARALRRGAYWNLADYTLWASAVGWIRHHVACGESKMPSPWLHVGPLRLAPATSYALTPIGAERTFLTDWSIGRFSGRLDARWSDPLQGRRLVGGGATLNVGKPGSLLRSVTADFWRRAPDAVGARLEAAGGWQPSPSGRLGLRWTLGVKSRGYLLGFDDRAYAYGGFGLRASF